MPHAASNVLRTLSRSTSGSSAPGRPVNVSSNFFAPLLVRPEWFGKSTRIPRAPWKNSTTHLTGNSANPTTPSPARRRHVYGDHELGQIPNKFLTRAGHFDDITESRSLASARLTAGHCSAKPFCVAWNSMCSYWPPGISWAQHLGRPDFRPLSNAAYDTRRLSVVDERRDVVHCTPVSKWPPANPLHHEGRCGRRLRWRAAHRVDGHVHRVRAAFAQAK